jgi:hypothetical protein
MRASIVILAAAAVSFLVSGCGSSSSSSSASDWQVVTQGQVSGKATSSFIKGRVGRPSDVELTVETTPSVKVKTEYTMICGTNLDDDATGRKTYHGVTGDAPTTSQVLLPLGPPASCFISAVATKAAPATMTFKLLSRPSSSA